MVNRLLQCFQNWIHRWGRRKPSGRDGEEDPLPWMKKAIMQFIFASVAGLIANGSLKDHSVLTQFPSYAILISFSAFFTSSLLHYFGLVNIARLSDFAGVFSGTLAFSWVVSYVIKGKQRWLAFLSCIFPLVLFVLELFQVLADFEFLRNLSVSEDREGQETQTPHSSFFNAGQETQTPHSSFFNVASNLVKLVYSFLDKIRARVIDAFAGRTTPAAGGNLRQTN